MTVIHKINFRLLIDIDVTFTEILLTYSLVKSNHYSLIEFQLITMLIGQMSELCIKLTIVF